jgi:hypothetical protein
MRKYIGQPVFNAEGAGGAPGGAPGGNPPPSQPPAASAAPWGADVNAPWNVGDKPWFETLPDGPTKDLLKAKNYANPAILADAYYSANKMISAPDRTIVLPGETATEQERAAFDARLRQVRGALDAPEKYELKMPDGQQADPNLLKFGQQIAHKYGLSAKEAQGLVDDWNRNAAEWNTAAQQAQQQANDAAIAEMKTKYGAEFDTKIAEGQRVVKSLGLDNALLDKIEASVGAAPLLDLLFRIGAKGGEGSVIGNGNNADPTNPATMTPQQAQAEVNRLNADPAFQQAYTTANHPGHKDAVEKMAMLFSRL